MPKFIYAGTRRDNGASDGNEAASIVVFGHIFPKGIPVEVTDVHAIRKLSGNAYFRTVVDEPSLPEQAPEIGAALTPEPVNAPTPRKRAKKERAE